MTQPFFNDDQQTALDLMVSLMEHNARETNFLTNSLMESYEEDAKFARAELKAIRIQMNSLFSTGYMPTESAIFGALVPDPELVQRIVESGNVF